MSIDAMRRQWWRSIGVGVAAGGALVFAVTGCSGSQDDAVSSAVEQYAAALQDGDGAQACDILAPSVRSELEQSTGDPCERAVLDEAVVPDGPAGQVEVYGLSAQVRLPGDTVFLTRFDDGWHVSAASCEPTPRDVYDCRVKGS